jgi:hypothetical protein
MPELKYEDLDRPTGAPQPAVQNSVNLRVARYATGIPPHRG